MNWLLKLLRYRDREYRGEGFSVRIEPIMREVVSVIHVRQGARLNLSGERIGKKWEGIDVRIPEEVDAVRAYQVACDLEAAFRAMGYGYVIARLAGVEVVPEIEQQAAITELRGMGYEVEVSPDRRKIHQKRVAGAPRPDIETARKQAPRIMSLIQTIHGTRQLFEVLAKSKEY
jgi:hypothetical protein